MTVSPSVFYNDCYGNYAVPAINVWSMEQIHALFRAAVNAGAPFIVQMTPAAVGYANMDMLLSMIRAASEIYPAARFSIHLDHGSMEVTKAAIASGKFQSVMIDASHEPFEKNVATTREIVNLAHNMGVEVEAELGVLSGVEDELDISGENALLTDPSMAEDFVKQTGCDSLAVAIGTSHGAYKFKGEQRLRFSILEEIGILLPKYPLVLHGGSSIDPREVERINASGGKLGKDAGGVPPAQIQKAITLGICKVNIASDARIVWTRVHREHFQLHPEQIDPVVPGNQYMKELEKMYREKFILLATVNKNKERPYDKR